MGIMIKFAFPVETGNDAIRTRKVEKIFKQFEDALAAVQKSPLPPAALEGLTS